MFHIITYKEWEYYIGKTLENSVSSFGDTEKEAYSNTVEALKLFQDDENIQRDIVEVSSPKIYSLNLTHA